MRFKVPYASGERRLIFYGAIYIYISIYIYIYIDLWRNVDEVMNAVQQGQHRRALLGIAI